MSQQDKEAQKLAEMRALMAEKKKKAEQDKLQENKQPPVPAVEKPVIYSNDVKKAPAMLQEKQVIGRHQQQPVHRDEDYVPQY